MMTKQQIAEVALNLNRECILAKGHVSNQVPDLALDIEPEPTTNNALDVQLALELGVVYQYAGCLFLSEEIVKDNFEYMWGHYHDVGRFGQPLSKDQFYHKLISEMPKPKVNKAKALSK